MTPMRQAKLTTDMTFARLKMDRARERLAESFDDLSLQLRLFGDAVLTANAKAGGKLFQGEED